jgi:hypothetical protein
MVHGNWEGKTLDDPEVRGMFDRQAMLDSDWYRARLDAKRRADINLWRRHKEYLESFVEIRTHSEIATRMNLPARIKQAEERLEYFSSDEYLSRIEGTLGTDPHLVPLTHDHSSQMLLAEA